MHGYREINRLIFVPRFRFKLLILIGMLAKPSEYPVQASNSEVSASVPGCLYFYFAAHPKNRKSSQKSSEDRDSPQLFIIGETHYAENTSQII